jgi:hypothetical protein
MLVKDSNDLSNSGYLPIRLAQHHILGNFVSVQLFDSPNTYLRDNLSELKSIIFEKGSIIFPKIFLEEVKILELQI